MPRNAVWAMLRGTADARLEAPELEQLQDAVARGNHKEAEELLHRRAAPDVGRCNDGWTALHVAVHHGRMDILALLLPFCSNVDARTSYGATALSFALADGGEECARVLIDEGAQLTLVSKRCFVPKAIQEHAVRRSRCQRCRSATVAFLHALRHTSLAHILPKDVVVLLAKRLWHTRHDEAWDV